MVKNINKYKAVYLFMITFFIGLFLTRFNYLPPQVPLFFSKLDGDDQLADTWMISFLPLSSLAFLWFNDLFRKRFIYDSYVENIFEHAGWGCSISLILISIYILLLVT